MICDIDSRDGPQHFRDRFSANNAFATFFPEPPFAVLLCDFAADAQQSSQQLALILNRVSPLSLPPGFVPADTVWIWSIVFDHNISPACGSLNLCCCRLKTPRKPVSSDQSDTEDIT
jgi:hypothetical protein